MIWDTKSVHKSEGIIAKNPKVDWEEDWLPNVRCGMLQIYMEIIRTIAAIVVVIVLLMGGLC